MSEMFLDIANSSGKRSMKPPDPPTLGPSKPSDPFAEPRAKAPRTDDFNGLGSKLDPLKDTDGDILVGTRTEADDELGMVSEDDITESTVRKMCTLLEKRILANQEARTKFPDQPTKFMDSEVELQETLESMQILAANPNLYGVLAAQTRPLHLLIGLLSHDNTDISVNVIDLLHSLLEPTGLKDSDSDAVGPLLEFFFSNQLVQLLTQNLSRLDESVRDEAEGVHTTLGIIESLLDIRPDMAMAIAQQGIYSWLLRRIQRRQFDKNKLYVSEVLAILLQLDDANKTRLGEMDGIDVLLQQLAAYKRHDPGSREEAEMMYNLFDCLCSTLMLASNKDKFLKGEGVQLMNLMLRERHAARDCALKVLDYAMSVVAPGESGGSGAFLLSEGEAAAAANCNKFVEVLGLRTIFPLFMHSPQAKGAKLAAAIREKSLPGPTSAEMEEHIISIVAALLRQCTGAYLQRVLAKFTENEHEKVDRLVELHFQYYEQVTKANAKIETFRERLSKRPDVSKEEVDEVVALKRMDSGLLSLQLIDVSLLFIAVNGAPSIFPCIQRFLKMRGASTSTLVETVRDYAESLGESRTAMTTEKARVLRLIGKFGELNAKSSSLAAADCNNPTFPPLPQ
ncbi:Beta-catenin-like protein 1 [Taenia crassiceps]|uniref:Beta-catenin-like protein 1 n=1 Tax=Taenia crassiceps TaxID=6207 RepID=A0ABR4Q023_9CEST